MDNKINKLNGGVALLILMVAGLIIYCCVQMHNLNNRIDTTQQLIMEVDDNWPITTDRQMNEAMLKSFDTINVMHDMLVGIDIKTDEVKNIIPSYVYKKPNEYDGIACDGNNNCKRYIYIDDDYFHELPTNS